MVTYHSVSNIMPEVKMTNACNLKHRDKYVKVYAIDLKFFYYKFTSNQ